MGNKDGIWICKPSLVIVLSSLLRKEHPGCGKDRVESQNKQSRAEELYGFITGHGFTHQVEAMIEVYGQMKEQITRERTACEKSWKNTRNAGRQTPHRRIRHLRKHAGYCGQCHERIKGCRTPGEESSLWNLTDGYSQKHCIKTERNVEKLLLLRRYALVFLYFS